MIFTRMGTYLPEPQPDRGAEAMARAELVCPFSDKAPNEDVHSELLFSDADHFDRRVGKYLGIHVGAASSGGFREQGSSGGLTNWLLVELLRTGKVDGVVGVGASQSSNAPLFAYRIARNECEVREFAKSKYYPVEISKVIDEIRSVPGRYAIVGVPCFAKMIRNLCLDDPVLAERIKYVVAIVCGHLKSAAFAESLAWQVGVHPAHLRKFDFRVKIEGKPANRYAISAEGDVNGETVVASRQVFDLYGTDWGLGFFKLNACDYCDDIAGETADVTLGDAWLPRDVGDWRGTNILIVRNKEILTMLRAARTSGEIVLRDAGVVDFVNSQGANYRHRHEGLAYRLRLKDQANQWRPAKRIQPDGRALSRKRQRLMEVRTRLALLSHQSFLAAKLSGQIKFYYKAMNPPSFNYYYRSGALVKFLIKRLIIVGRRLHAFAKP